jgi:hypothetical protein
MNSRTIGFMLGAASTVALIGFLAGYYYGKEQIKPKDIEPVACVPASRPYCTRGWK